MPKITCHPKIFLVRINKAEQKARREKIGDLYLNPNNVFMTRNQQYGQILHIGKEAAEWLPEAEQGDHLLFHHSIEGTLDDRGGHDKRQRYERHKYEVMEDKEFIVYQVHMLQSYGVVKPGRISPSRDWLFCKKYEEPRKEEIEYDETGRALVRNASGIVTYANFDPSRTEKEVRLKDLEKQVESLGKTGIEELESNSRERNKRAGEVKLAMTELMNEMQRLTKELTKPRYINLQVYYSNPWVNEEVEVELGPEWLVGYYARGEDVPFLEYNSKIYSLVKTSMIGYVVQMP